MKMTLLKEKNSLVLCSMNYLKTILIFILCINLSTDEVNNEDYKIEMIIFLNQDVDTEELFSSKLTIPQEDFISYLEPKLYLNNSLLTNLNNKNEFYDLLSSVQLNNIVKKDSSKKPVANPNTWFRKNEGASTLDKLSKRIKSNNKYIHLKTLSWIHPIFDEGKSKYLHYQDNNNFGFFIRLYKNRFLHTDLKAYIGHVLIDEEYISSDYVELSKREMYKISNDVKKNIDINLKLNKEIDYAEIITKEDEYKTTKKIEDITIFIDESRRIFDEEIHFYDHPYFGVIVLISKI